MSSWEAVGNRSRRLWIVASLASLLPFAPAAAATPKKPRTAERAWIARSVELAKIAKNHGNAADFRRDILAHRERLREIVRASKNPPPALLQLQRSMILVNALLNAASECHSGGRLVCPADLMQQLEDQLRTVAAQLDALDGGHS